MFHAHSYVLSLDHIWLGTMRQIVHFLKYFVLIAGERFATACNEPFLTFVRNAAQWSLVNSEQTSAVSSVRY
jgi:hypothetical protein